jgi:hypothetical protein
MSLRVLLVHPGASVATHDVFVGLKAGLLAHGATVYDYALDGRIERSGQYLHYCWRKGKKAVDRPSHADVLYHAGEPLVARALRVQPDVVLIVSAMYLHPDIFVLLRRAGLRTALLCTESPYDDDRQARLVPFVDACWTHEYGSAVALGVRYLPHAWTPGVHDRPRATPDTPAHDVVFVGTGFQERIDMLGATDWTGIDLGLYGSWDLLGSRNPLRRYVRGGYVENERTTALYQRAKIGLNLYRMSMGFGRDAPRVPHAHSLNPRAYELAATGCFTLSDVRPEVAAVFGDLVPTFATPGELRALLDRWLVDDVGRARISARLPAAVAGATWHHRARQVLSDLANAGIVARGDVSTGSGEPRAVGG